MAPLKLDPTPARQFLETLYGPFFSQAQGAAYLEVRGKREGEGMSFRQFYQSPEALLKDMGRWQPGLNYWVGVALRKDSKGGAKANLLALSGAFADIDVGTAGHKNASTYETKAEALAAIEAFPLRPTILIDSGGGFQCYWRFREPVHLAAAGGDARSMIARLEGINRGLSLSLGGDVAASDAARILRLPGTFNMKLTGQPRPVVMVWCESERVYDLAALAKHEDKPKAQAQGRERGPQAGTSAPPQPGGEYAAYSQKALADELAALARTPEGSRNARLNQAAFALGQLVGAGVLDRGAVEAGLSGVAAVIGLGEVETRATIKSGLDRGISEPRTLPEKAQGRRNGPGQGDNPASPEKGNLAGQGEAEAERYWWVGHCYFVDRGKLCLEKIGREGEPSLVSLANFQARITEEVYRDDGLRRSKEFQITGNLDTGQALPLVLVPAEKYDSLAWVKREWGAAASVAPGRSLGPHLANAIQAHSRGFKRRTVYAHSGWRKIGDAWRYLHGGGGIGTGEPVEVDLGENLGHYRLPEPGGFEAAQASLRFLDVAPLEITAPLLAGCYLAPFADLCKTDFSLWLYGPTGSMKSTLAALALGHFGTFDRLTLPGSWFSTVNSLEKLCHALKDSLIVIDDFAPANSAGDAQRMAGTAGRLIYQAGNRSSRGRLAPDLSARPNYYPRGLILSTGEVLLPGQRQSATARYLGIELDPKKTPIDKARLTEAQGEAAAGLYAAAMAAYLTDLAGRLDEVQEEIPGLWGDYRAAFQSGGHARLPEILSWLAVGFELAMRFFVRQGAMTGDEAYEMEKRAWQVFRGLGDKHSRIIEGERPTLKFLTNLSELFLTSRIYAESKDFQGAKPPDAALLGWQGNEPAHNAYLVGYADETMLYLIPGAAYKAINEAVRQQGDYLALGKNEMLAALAREGIIEPGRGGRTTRIVNIYGGNRRVLCLSRDKLTPGEAENGPE